MFKQIVDDDVVDILDDEIRQDKQFTLLPNRTQKIRQV